QQSILDNLNPQLIKEGLLMRPKEGQQTEANEKSRTDRLRLSIADKLQRVFDISDDDYFYGNYSAWLIRDVLLQGHLYLTRDSILFFAFLPKRYSVTSESESNYDDSNIVVQSGTLGLKTGKYGDSMFTTVLTHRYWAVLRSETLSIYSSSTDLYFPKVVIDLKTCIRAEIADKDRTEIVRGSSPPRTPRVGSGTATHSPISRRGSGDNSTDEEIEISNILAQESIAVSEDNFENASTGVWIKLITKKKNYKFFCDSLFSARQWCNNITKLIFQLNNSNAGNEVLLKIPIEDIVDYEKSKLFEEDSKDSNVPEDEIPVSMSFSKKLGAFDMSKKRSSSSASLNSDGQSSLDHIFFMFFRDGHSFYESLNAVILDHKNRLNEQSEASDSSDKFFEKAKKIPPQILSPTSSTNRIKKLGRTLSNPAKLLTISRRSSEDSANSERSLNDLDFISSPDLYVSNQQLNFPRPLTISGLKSMQMSFETSQKDPNEAESEFKKNEVKDFIDDEDEDKSLMAIGKSIKAFSKVGSKWSAFPAHFAEQDGIDDDFFVQNQEVRELTERHYQEHFSLNKEKKLVATYYAHLQRSIPVYGKVYLGDTDICFRSLLPGVQTKMILPLSEVVNCYREKGLKLTYSGLVIVVNGQHELFLEFSSQKSRDDCEFMILSQLEKLHGGETWAPSPHQWGSNYEMELTKTRLMTGVEDHPTEFSFSEQDLKRARTRIENARIKMFEDKFNAAAGLDVPIILEDSPLFKTEIKPSTSYNFTLLTIGSRGDVQPFIALGKGLMKEGHNVTIATHAEFEDWIVKHGMKFKLVSGNPAELMSLMVTHGSMSVGFLKEASSKFRGWINELLTSSWQACQGADILIESPAAMAGVHIAEALGIPYLRAFTMPWTRTRAYPHAFIVPDQKKGGSYNYLTHVMFETVFWRGISGQINKWRVKELGLPSTNLFRLQSTKIPFMYNVSPTIFPPAVDFPDWVKVTGYWFLDEGAAADYNPPEELIEFMELANEDGKKIVYIGFGSIVVKDANSLTRAIVEAVLDADVRCILNKGWSDRLSKNQSEPVELPPEIYDSGSIPHDWLFPRIDAAVHHGGSGTTGATLRCGLPTIIKPFFGDQFFYASRVEEIGVGVGLKNLNARSLSKAITKVISDLKLIERSKKVAEKIKRENGVMTAIETIYSELEYARNLILSKQQHNENYRLHMGTPSGIQSPNVEEDDEYTDTEKEEDEEDYTDESEDEGGDDYEAHEDNFSINNN
ncbi:Sterol 3-beta-glucosyltransferase (Autophagy-related protein 26) (UDP-glycosyltransferase 51), partial [Scheffersomyces stipitis CBS 6054]